MSAEVGREASRGWLAQALALGALAEGTTSPNPRVGCVLVRDGRMVGCGLHRAAGQPHAEAVALEQAGAEARGATLFVNLEPCAHVGRTGPCTELLIRAGVRRVVACLQDPNPLVDGRGFAVLRSAGVEVEVGQLEAEARELNAPFLHWHASGTPLVTLKAAVSLDGMLAASGGESRWISGAAARRFAHRLRLRHDAVLVGAGTVRRDDPRLTARLPGGVVHRRRAILSLSLRIDPRSHVFEPASGGARTRIYTSERTDDAAAAPFAGRAEIVRVPEDGSGGLSLDAVLGDLGALGVQSVLVEGGARTFASFLGGGRAQRGALFVSGTLLGSRGGTPMLDRPAVVDPGRGWRLQRRRVLPVGDDWLVLGRFVPPG